MASCSNVAAEKHSLKGTRYERLEQEVKRMVHGHKRDRDDHGHEEGEGYALKKKTNSVKKTMSRGNDIPTGAKRVKKEHSTPIGVPLEKNKTPIKRPPSSISDVTIPESAQGYTNDRTVYIQGLPFSCEENDVRNFFVAIGTIESLRLPKWHDSGKLKGYGHVQFSSSEEAEKALELSGSYIKDRFISVDRPMVPRALSQDSSSVADKVAAKPPGCKTIFLRNLPYEVTETEIREKFMVYGPIMKVRLAVWNHTNNLKGFGYIDFKREDSADIAVKKSGNVVIQGRIISVDYEASGPKAGYKGDKVLAPPRGFHSHNKNRLGDPNDKE